MNNDEMRAAEAPTPHKLTGDEDLQRKLEEAMSPQAADLYSGIRAAEAPAPHKLTGDEDLQRKLEEAMSPQAASLDESGKQR